MGLCKLDRSVLQPCLPPSPTRASVDPYKHSFIPATGPLPAPSCVWGASFDRVHGCGCMGSPAGRSREGLRVGYPLGTVSLILRH